MDPFSIIAPTASADGYGCSAEGMVLSAVHDHKADIAFIEYDWRDSRYTDSRLFDLQVGAEQYDARPILIVYFLPYGLTRFRSQVNINMTMWETDRLPDQWTTIINFYANGGVIVPSLHSKQVFEQSVGVPVVSAPFGTDTKLYEWYDRRERGNEIVFGMAGLLHYRKGVEFALRALREEFTKNEPVRMVLKTRRGFLDCGSEYNMLGDPRVNVIDEDFTREQMRDFYYWIDCLLAPSRGEGSGLTPRDAMATGLPVVVTDWGGLQEIADERYTYPIEVEALVPAPAENTSYGPGVTGGGDIGCFAQPSVEHLRARMREVYENRQNAYEKGRHAASWTRDQWTWERCSGLWLEALEELTSKVIA